MAALIDAVPATGPDRTAPRPDTCGMQVALGRVSGARAGGARLPQEALRELFEIHRDSLGYSVADLASLFAVHPEEVMSTYPVVPTVDEARRHLRAL